MASNKSTSGFSFAAGAHKESFDTVERQCLPSNTLQMNYLYYADRIATFATWPKSMPISPDELARAGFVYTGYGDKVHCPWCDLRLVDFERNDKPLEEHAKHTKGCPYLRMAVPSLPEISSLLGGSPRLFGTENVYGNRE